MVATEILRNEHRVIERVLACVAAIAERCAVEQELDSRAAERAIDFFRTFADGCHHLKEEQFLFPALEAKGWPHQQGPTGRMVLEHRLGREYLDAMNRAVQQNNAASFCQAASDYIGLLRQHIAKEDNVLFPMADDTLTGRDEQWLLEQFRRHEEELAAGTHERYLQLANDLTRQLGLPSAAATENRCSCVCSGVRRNTSEE
jgi:hemerythrin-like domain-containing protein